MAQTIQGKRVSRDWHTVLSEAQRRKVPFQLNSGQRTMAEQAELRARYLRGEGPLAAVPSCSAPHIRCGRQDHALDVQCGPTHQRLLAFLHTLGIDTTHPVRGECWHIEVPADQLARAAKRLRRKAAIRARYMRVRAAILRRQAAGKASPGLRQLLKRLREQLRRA